MATEPADAPTTTFPCRTITRATASSETASDNPALSAYRRLVRAASARYLASLRRSASSAFCRSRSSESARTRRASASARARSAGFVQPRTIERLRGVTARGSRNSRSSPPIVRGVRNAQRHGADRPARGNERDDDVALAELQESIDRRLPGLARRRRRLDDDQLAAANGFGER